MAIKLFITGTDTGIGKTTFAALFAKELVSCGKKVHVLKPAESGCEKQPSGELIAADAVSLWEASSRTQDKGDVCVYRFEEPVAPAVAASEAQESIDFARLDDAVESQAQGADVLLIEGAGGLLVPLGSGGSYADWIARLEIPTIVVVGSRLGVINHSLLTFEVLKARGIPTLGYVFNDMFKASLADQSISSNRQVLAREAKKYGFGEVAYLPFDEAQASDRADFQGLLAKLSKGNICQ